MVALTNDAQVKVLFCCMGNICRSPTAHGVFEKLVREAGLTDKITVDSAGTHAYHVGESPDSRSQEAALKRGYDLSTQRARRAVANDFYDFDYVLAMDGENLANLRRIQAADSPAQLALLLDFAPQHPEREVPDPYYGGARGFEHVLDLVEAASAQLLADIRKERGW